jgi:aminoglycoside phosphotransferase
MNNSFPTTLQSLIHNFVTIPIITGHSDARVYKLEHPDKPALFLKIQESDALDSLEAEARTLDWLHDCGVQVPRVQAFLEEDQQRWLLTSAISGRDAASAWRKTEVSKILEVMAKSLKNLHALEIQDCPFDQSLEIRLSEAYTRIVENLVDETDFDPQRLGKTAEHVFLELLGTQPKTEDLVFTHGDFCLPNIMIHNLEFAGFIDLGRAGIADRYQDLALMTRSLESDLNPQFNGWSSYFLEQYGILEPDEKKLEFYRLLDEFF